MKDKAKLREVLQQYEDGAITFCEFVNYAICCIDDENRKEYKDVYNEPCPY